MALLLDYFSTSYTFVYRITMGKMNSITTFIIADNQDITRRGLHGYITDLFETAQIIDVNSRQELVRTLAEHDTKAIVILDYTLFDLNGTDELLVIGKRFPETRWLLFSNELSEDFIRKLSIEENISMVLKENSGEEIHAALHCLSRGDRFFCHQIANLLINHGTKTETESVLTSTETEVLKLIAHGKSVKEIANERNSSIHTIISHKKNIFRKLGVNSVYEATKYALRAGLIEMMEFYI